MSNLPQPHTPSSATSPTADDADRTLAGSNYGDVTPSGDDPFRGAELERDALPADADFSRRAGPGTPGAEPEIVPDAVPGPDTQATELSREERIRRAAHARYEQRGGIDGHAVQDWLEAEAEIDGQAR